MPQNRHIAIVGGGLVGISSAIWLLRRGCRVTVIDRDVDSAASSGSGGILACSSFVPVPTPTSIKKAPFMLLHPNEPMFIRWERGMMPWLAAFAANGMPTRARRISQSLLPLLHDALAEHRLLAAETAAAKRICESDYLYLYADRGGYEKDSFGWDLRRAGGLQWSFLQGAELHEAVPGLSSSYTFAAALPAHGFINSPGDYLQELKSSAAESGAKFVCAQITRAENGDGGAILHDDKGGRIGADVAVVAAGAWSQDLAAPLGCSVAMKSERGYHLEFDGATTSLPLVDAARKTVATPLSRRLRFVGVAEYGGLHAPPSAAPLRMLEKSAKRMFPALANITPSRRWMGLRPSTTDSLPIIGCAPRADKIFFAYGHQHIGLTASAKTGRLVAQLLSGDKPDIDLAPYCPGRKFFR